MMQFLKNYWREILIGAIGVAVIHAFLLSPAFWGGHGIRPIDANTASQFGQFIAGYLGTMVLLGSVIAIVATLRWQVQTGRRTAFETRFFELLKYHRENVSEIALGKREGRRTFVLLFREFREVLMVVEEAIQETGAKCSVFEKINIAYMAFYYGAGPQSEPVLRENLLRHDGTLVTALANKLSEEDRRVRVQKAQNFVFVPFQGHRSRRGLSEDQI